jgi:hypothetical protein
MVWSDVAAILLERAYDGFASATGRVEERRSAKLQEGSEKSERVKEGEGRRKQIVIQSNSEKHGRNGVRCRESTIY